MSEKSNIISIFEGYEKKKERRGLRKRGVKIHPPFQNPGSALGIIKRAPKKTLPNETPFFPS